MRKKKKIRVPRPLKTVYCVVVEGKTEHWYLQLIKKHENLKKIHIRPKLPKRKKLSEIKELIIELLKEDYDQIFWLIDLDHFINNHQIDKLKKVIGLLTKKDKLKKLEILINNPCLEFWYLLHFRDTGKYYSHCEKVIKEIKNYPSLNSYQKSEKYYKRNPDIYQRLKPYQKYALERAYRLDTLNQEPLHGASAQIYNLLKKLGIT
jgi:hypothetical protein